MGPDYTRGCHPSTGQPGMTGPGNSIFWRSQLRPNWSTYFYEVWLGDWWHPDRSHHPVHPISKGTWRGEGRGERASSVVERFIERDHCCLVDCNAAVCERRCVNGGRCIAPSRCLCPRGFVPPFCERSRHQGTDTCATHFAVHDRERQAAYISADSTVQAAAEKVIVNIICQFFWKSLGIFVRYFAAVFVVHIYKLRLTW